MTKHILKCFKIVLFIILVLQTTGCSKDEKKDNPPVITGILIKDISSSLPVGLEVQLNALAVYSNGTSIDITNEVIWETSNTLIATINTTGLMTGKSIGLVSINIKYTGFISTKDLTITNAILKSISISPPQSTMKQYEELQLTAIGTYSDSSKLDLTSSAVWTSSNQTVVIIDNKGLVTAQSVGLSTITVKLSGISSITEIDVNIAVTRYQVSNTSEFRTVLALLNEREHSLILLSPGTYNTSDSGSGRFIIDSIFASVKLQGDGDGVILDGNGENGVLKIAQNYMTIEFNNITIQNGLDNSISGGGALLYSNTTFTDCVIQNNQSNRGGGIYQGSENSLTFINTQFLNNQATYEGGAIKTDGELSITGSSFIGNIAKTGATIYTESRSTPFTVTVSNSKFVNNNASLSGGFYSKNIMKMTNTIYENNSPAFFIADGIIINSLFINNNNGAISFLQNVKVLNSSFINNSNQDIIGSLNATAKIDYSFIDVSNIGISYLSSNIVFDSNPLFVNYNNSDFHLQAQSAMVNAGTDSFDSLIAPTKDLDGISRPQGVAVDIGPYEYVE